MPARGRFLRSLEGIEHLSSATSLSLSSTSQCTEPNATFRVSLFNEEPAQIRKHSSQINDLGDADDCI
jgi:hypothetical protein